MNFFESVELAPPDPILGLNAAFKADPRENKVNLGAGIYKTSDLKPLILNSVKKAEKILLHEENSKDYLPIDGDREYIDKVKELVFGKELDLDLIYGAHTTAGTGGLRAGAAFLKNLGLSTIYLSNPTWENHQRIFHQAGFEVKSYPYFDWEQNGLDFTSLKQKISEMPSRSMILLQASCHNPTGIDLSEEQWNDICALIQKKRLLPFFDSAYQGFGHSLEKDVWPIRHFAQKKMEFVLSVSHSKNFGLYAERTGALFFFCNNVKQKEAVASQVKVMIRGLYSNPPCHGARIVKIILSDPKLREEWENELKLMRERISEMRKALVASLEVHHTENGRAFDYLSHQKGMFSYTGLEKKQVERLKEQYGIYLPSDGRINVAGLNTNNISYVAEAIRAIFQK